MDCPDSILGLPCRVWEKWNEAHRPHYGTFIWIIDEKWFVYHDKTYEELRIYSYREGIRGDFARGAKTPDELGAYRAILGFLKEHYHEA